MSHGQIKFENLKDCCGNRKWVSNFGKIWWVLKKLNRELPKNSTISLLVYAPKNWKQGFKEIHAHPCFSSSIHNSQKVKIARMFINGWLNEQTVAYPYNGLLFSQKKKMKCWYMLWEWTLKTWCQVEEARYKRSRITWFHL